MLSGRATAVLHVRPAGGPYDVLFKGLYLGPNVDATVIKRADFFELEVRPRAADPETGRVP